LQHERVRSGEGTGVDSRSYHDKGLGLRGGCSRIRQKTWKRDQKKKSTVRARRVIKKSPPCPQRKTPEAGKGPRGIEASLAKQSSDSLEVRATVR